MWSIPADLLQEHRKLSLEECSQPGGPVPLGGGHISAILHMRYFHYHS